MGNVLGQDALCQKYPAFARYKEIVPNASQAMNSITKIRTYVYCDSEKRVLLDGEYEKLEGDRYKCARCKTKAVLVEPIGYHRWNRWWQAVKKDYQVPD